MSNLRSAFETKDFVINKNIIKVISEIDINLEEFLLILYFINVSPLLDSEDIKSKLGFTDEKVFSTFTSLLNKKYIGIDVTQDKDKVIEKVNLNMFYDRLLLNEKIETHESDIYALFEKELGRTLSSFEYELINKWIENGTSEETIKEALKEAILNNVRNFKYIDKIIYEWSKNGTKKRIKEDKDEKIDMFDYDWLDDNE